ncbi:MAG: RDD family protein [Dehalococcoidia bacterium]|nr:RDD family protein [Dehalococcoidia bacterium]
MPDIAPAGYYHAEGDPEGTVRYWDGANWSGEPKPLDDQPDLRGSTLDPTAVNPAVSADNSRYGGLGIRIGAAAIDTAIGVVIIAPFSASVLLAGLALSLYWVVVVVMVAKLGGSPGKLAVGLRVTKIDGVTSPPGDRESVIRTLPGLLGLIPIVGGLISLGIGLISIRYVAIDPQRRSIYDRIGGTRVVYKNRLS